MLPWVRRLTEGASSSSKEKEWNVGIRNEMKALCGIANSWARTL